MSLTRGAVRRRIPLTAVEEARTPDGRTLEIVLTAAPGRAATTYRFTSRYAATLAALRDAVNAARPRGTCTRPVSTGNHWWRS